MTWVRLDDTFPEHGKVDRLSDAAFRLHVSALCYCARNLTDGVIPAIAVRRLVPRFRRQSLAELLDAGLWHERADGAFVVHDFLSYNPSREQVQAERDDARRRRELHATPELVEAIRARDKGRCRYCGVVVNWKDRRGARGATYDHVDPKGGNSLENVVVACRGCNSSKRNRTPSEAGMTLTDLGRDLEPIQVDASRSRSSHPARPGPARPDAVTGTSSSSSSPVARDGVEDDDEKLVAEVAWVLAERALEARPSTAEPVLDRARWLTITADGRASLLRSSIVAAIVEHPDADVDELADYAEPALARPRPPREPCDTCGDSGWLVDEPDDPNEQPLARRCPRCNA